MITIKAQRITSRLASGLCLAALLPFTAIVWTSAQGGADDAALRGIIKTQGLKGDAILSRLQPIPAMDEPMVVLGKALFWTKALSADREVACVTCHHPFLGFGDGLPLPVGVDAEFSDRLGPGRKRKKTDLHQTPRFGKGDAPMPRNSPTLIGLAFWDQSITWDGTVFSDTGTPGMSGVDGRILAPVDTPPVRNMFTHPMLPRSDYLTYEEKWDKGMPISSGHGLLPTAVNAAMRGRAFGAKTAPTMPSHTDLEVREALAAVLGGYGKHPELTPLTKNQWEPLFRAGYKDPSGPIDKLITTNKISVAIAAYERTMTFTNTPWKAYVQGKDAAINASAKRGALLFYKPIAEGGANCASCHKGDFFTDEQVLDRRDPAVRPRQDRHQRPQGRDRRLGPRARHRQPRRQVGLPDADAARRRDDRAVGPRRRVQHAGGDRPPPPQRGKVDQGVRLEESVARRRPSAAELRRQPHAERPGPAEGTAQAGPARRAAGRRSERRAGQRPGRVPEGADRPVPEGQGLPGEVDPGRERSGP